MPSDEMTPCVTPPPGIPETLQVTAALEEFDTVAESESSFPSSTDALPGVTLTEIDGTPGGGGFEAGTEAVPAQPATVAHSVAIEPRVRALLSVVPIRTVPEAMAGVCKQCVCHELKHDGRVLFTWPQLAAVRGKLSDLSSLLIASQTGAAGGENCASEIPGELSVGRPIVGQGAQSNLTQPPHPRIMTTWLVPKQCDA